MTIKEIEQATGLPRASVRFYESEGLIAPARGENGYRSYSPDDRNTLLKIKLLRQLDVPLEDIQAMQKGTRALESVLDEALTRLERESDRLERSHALCRDLRADHPTYQQLDPQPYLKRLEQPSPAPTPGQPTPSAPPTPVYDRLPDAHCPFRRFFARNFDLFVYNVLFILACQRLFRVNLIGDSDVLRVFTGGLVPVFVTLLVEPLLLHFFCTTPGKFLFGLRITRGDGSPLSLREAFSRTGGVLLRGLGLGIPVITDITQGYSLYQIYKGRRLGWDYDLDEVAYWDGSRPGSSYWDCSKSYVKLIAAGILTAVGIFAIVNGHYDAMAPRHQGDMSVAQFVENYNDTARFRLQSGSELTHLLTEDGTFKEIEYPGRPTQIIIDSFDQAPPVEFEWTVEDGVLQGVSFIRQAEGNTLTAIPYEEMAYTVWSLLYGLEGVSTDELNRVCEELTRLGGGTPSPNGSVTYHHSFSCAQVDFRMVSTDYILSSFGTIFPMEDGQPSCTMEFSLLRTA